MKSVGSCYLFFNISSHRHTVGKGTCELFQVGFGYITSPSPRRLRCFHVVIVFYRRRGYRRRMQLLLVGGMHCSVLMLMLLEFRRPFNTISIYFYINFTTPINPRHISLEDCFLHVVIREKSRPCHHSTWIGCCT